MAATATARSSATRKAPRRARAQPARRRGVTPSTGFVPVVAAAGAVGGLADSRMFVWLTRGRLWIGLLGALLVGIVGLNVVALQLSSSSSEAGQAADALRRQNSALRGEIASRLSNAEIQTVAANLGLVMPGPGAFEYLKVSADDARVAAERLRNGELTAGIAAVAPAAPTTTTVTAPTDVAAIDPAVAPETAPPVEAPVAAAPPAETVAPPAETVAPAADTVAAAGAVGAP